MPISTIKPVQAAIGHAKANGIFSGDDLRTVLEATGANPETASGLKKGDAKALTRLHAELIGASVQGKPLRVLPKVLGDFEKFMRAFNLLAADPVTPIHPPALSVLTPARQRLILDAVDNLVAQNGADKFNGHLPLPAGSSYSRHEIVDGLRKLIVIIPTGGAVVSGASQDANDPNNANVVGVEVHENGVTNHVWHIAQLNLATIDNAPPVTIGNNAMRIPLSTAQLLTGFRAVGGFSQTFKPMAEAPAAVTAALADVIKIGSAARGIAPPDHLAKGHASFGLPYTIDVNGQPMGVVFRGRSAADLVGFELVSMSQMS